MKSDEKPYSEERYYEGFKVIRNKLRKYDTTGLIRQCLEYLHAPAIVKIDYLQRHPWAIFLLIKWALIDEYAFEGGHPQPTQQQTLSLLQATVDLSGKVRMPSQYDNPRLFFRTIGYQQFIYQRETSLFTIARQFILFGDLPEDHYIRRTFFEIAGIEIQRFLELSQALLMRFIERQETKIHAHWFSSLQEEYTQQEVHIFLCIVSKSLDEVRGILLARDQYYRSNDQYPRRSSEYLEQSPFINFPLLRDGETYVCVDHHVLFRCVERFVYNVLRSNNPDRFMSHFGPVFERYVEQAIKHMGLPYMTEVEIERTLKRKSKPKLIDFLIADGNANIFVDAKAVEIAYQGKVTHDSDELAKWLETSALKAIEQAHSTLSLLPETISEDLVMRQRQQNYLVVVTHSELYVGNGSVLAEAVGAERVNNLIGTFSAALRIPLDNMFFVTIQEFECLAEAVRSKKLGTSEALEKAKIIDATPSTRMFEFQQHLTMWGLGDGIPDYVRRKAVDEIEKMASHLKK